MASTLTLRSENSEAAIFARLWDTREARLTPALARHVLKLRFSKQDEVRMHELAAKSREGLLTPIEELELDNFVRVGDLVAILQSKARKLLKQAPPVARHG